MTVGWLLRARLDKENDNCRLVADIRTRKKADVWRIESQARTRSKG